jgi:hypothetical protein
MRRVTSGRVNAALALLVWVFSSTLAMAAPAGAAPAAAPAPASRLVLAGAFGFGLVIGWFVYYVNRYRKDDVQLGDVVTLVGAIGGGAVLALFEAKSELFGAYGVGLACGFFGYFVILVILVWSSSRSTKNFTWEWFLDGRRKDPPAGESFSAGRAMDASQSKAQIR